MSDDFEIVSDPNEAEGVICLRVADAVVLAEPRAYGTCFRCDSPVVFHDIYPKALPKLCTVCALQKVNSHGPN